MGKIMAYKVLPQIGRNRISFGIMKINQHQTSGGLLLEFVASYKIIVFGKCEKGKYLLLE